MSGGGSSSSNGSSSSSSPNRPHHQRLPSIKTSPSSPASRHGGTNTTAATTPQPPSAATYTPPPPPPLLLTVRFSTSLPDLLLDIPHPHRTTVVALKHLIRSRLEQPNSQRRLRFIHGGKILPDHALLASVLKPIPPPPPASSTSSASLSSSRDKNRGVSGGGIIDPKGKGKAVVGGSGNSANAQRVYVNCSIGDLLTDGELVEEKRRAEEPVPEQQQQQSLLTSSSLHTPGTASPFPPGSSRHSPVPGGGGSAVGEERGGPRGFDRLLSAGFTAAEVNQLRLQFRSIQEARHTADTMPPLDVLRDMEDAWIDNNNAGMNMGMGMGTNGDGSGGDMLGGGGAGGGGEEFGMAGVLDLLLKGMFIGFIWPLGAIGWLVRDEEKIPKRMRVFVYFGFVLSLLIGTIRVIG